MTTPEAELKRPLVELVEAMTKILTIKNLDKTPEYLGKQTMEAINIAAAKLQQLIDRAKLQEVEDLLTDAQECISISGDTISDQFLEIMEDRIEQLTKDQERLAPLEEKK